MIGSDGGRRSTDYEALRAEIESFILGLSHDLKAPLANIKGFVELLEEGGLSRAQERHFLSRVRYNTEVMGRLIVDLAELSSIGVRPDPPEDVETAALIREALLPQERIIEERPAEMVVAPDLPRVRYPRGALLQVFANLVENALRHATDVPRLRIAIDCRTGDGEHCFRVADNGPGIDRQEQPKVFEPFYSRTKKSLGSSGLGLTMVKRIVETNGGRTWVEDAPGGGAAFFFTVPV